jgi:hypothetical protein
MREGTRQRLESEKARVYAQKPQLKLLFKNSIPRGTAQGGSAAPGGLHLHNQGGHLLAQVRHLQLIRKTYY